MRLSGPLSTPRPALRPERSARLIHREAEKGQSRKLGFRFYLFLRNSTLLSQHYDRYLPFGLTLVVGVSRIRLCEASPQP